ncbi:MAG: hypothetical protein AB7N71_08190 [Phycisphaerae bacterium]
MNPREFENMLARIAALGIDALTPHEIAKLEAHANAHPGAGSQLRALESRQSPPLAFVQKLPAAAEWDMVWQGISTHSAAAPGGAASSRRARTPWILRPMAAAAACVLMVGSLSWFTPLRADDMPLSFDAHAEILEIEVFDGDSSFVMCGGDEAECAFIWVVENEEADSSL